MTTLHISYPCCLHAIHLHLWLLLNAYFGIDQQRFGRLWHAYEASEQHAPCTLVRFSLLSHSILPVFSLLHKSLSFLVSMCYQWARGFEPVVGCTVTVTLVSAGKAWYFIDIPTTAAAVHNSTGQSIERRPPSRQSRPRSERLP
jgi:hypothetical protein